MNVAAVIFTFAGVYLYGAIAGFSGKAGDDLNPYVGFAGIMLALAVYALSGTLFKRLLKRSGKTSLKEYESRIHRRILDLHEAVIRIEQATKLTDGGREHLGTVARKTLASARLAVERLINEYQAKLREIDLIRLVNRVEAIRHGLADLTYEQCGPALQQISEIESEGRSKLESWCVQRLEACPPGLRCRQNLGKVIDLTASLREELIARQVHLAVKDISPLGSYHQAEEVSVEVSRDLSTIYHLDTLWAELGKLENENIRLQSEQEVLNASADL